MERDSLDQTLILPDEILCIVFSFVRSNEPVHVHSWLDVEPRTFGWVRITRVSRRWRQVAIRCPTLWTHLTGKLGSRWLEEFTQRSKSAPLYIDDQNFAYESSGWPSNEIRNPSLTKVLTVHRLRIATLRLHNAPREIVVEPTRGVGLPILADLYLWSEHLKADELSPGQLQDIMGYTTRLRRLHLDLPNFQSSTFDWKQPSLGGLTTLNIAMKTGENSLFSTELWKALYRMTSLVELALHENEGRRFTSRERDVHRCPGTPNNLIIMRRLESLVLEGPLEMHTHFLRHARPPSDARISFISQSTSDGGSAVHDALAGELSALLKSHENKPVFQAAYAGFSPTKLACLGLSRGVRPYQPLASFAQGPEDPHEHNRNNLDVRYLDRRWNSLLPHLPLGYIHTLTLHNAGPASIRTYLSLFPNVERLRLSVDRSFPRHDIGALEDRSLARMLRYIDMDASFFDLRTTLSCYSPQGAHVVPERFTVLENVLQARWEMGSPLIIFFHVKEEVEWMEECRIWHADRWRDIAEETMRRSVERLESIEGVQFIGRHVDLFGP
ncbi:unnamed protein product [Peniophora sp. CBMAI 1063]|nr:unnamed protein product [Peniophora sp. CBMAI 1063]